MGLPWKEFAVGCNCSDSFYGTFQADIRALDSYGCSRVREYGTHMQIGDIIFMKSIDRVHITTNEEGQKSDYKMFENYGDVILYHPYGDEGSTPIIHRAMYRVEAGEPMWEGGPPAPYSGYITKGDNVVTNQHFDQEGQISYLMPVKDDWVIGTAQYRIPYLGYIRLLFSRII